MPTGNVVAGYPIYAQDLADELAAATFPTLIGTTTRSSASSGFTTTETVLDYVTFTAVAGATYQLWCSTSLQSTVAADLIRFRMRYLAGASLTTSGTEFHVVTLNADIAAKGQYISTMRPVSGIAAGQTSIGVTAVRDTGTGTISSFGASTAVNVIQLWRVS